MNRLDSLRNLFGSSAVRWSFAAIVLYCVFLISMLPASFAARALPAELELVASHGTFWRGSGDMRHGEVHFPNVQWRVVAWRLLKGEIALRVNLDDSQGSATVISDDEELRVVAADVTVPAALLTAIIPELDLWQPRGNLHIVSDGFVLGHDHAVGRIELNWQDASLNLSRIKPLGNYRATIAAEGARAKLNVATGKGALVVAGAGEWSAQNGIVFNGTAKADSAPELRDLLRLIGEEDSNGAYRVSLAAQF